MPAEPMCFSPTRRSGSWETASAFSSSRTSPASGAAKSSPATTNALQAHRGGRRFELGEIESGRVGVGQADFERYVRELSNHLHRLRLRLTEGDYRDASPSPKV